MLGEGEVRLLMRTTRRTNLSKVCPCRNARGRGHMVQVRTRFEVLRTESSLNKNYNRGFKSECNYCVSVLNLTVFYKVQTELKYKHTYFLLKM